MGARQLDRYESIELKRRAELLERALAERDGQITRLNSTLPARDEEIATIKATALWRIAARLGRLRRGAPGRSPV